MAKDKTDIVNDSVEIAVELGREFEKRLHDVLGLSDRPDPLRQALRDAGVKLKDLRA